MMKKLALLCVIAFFAVNVFPQKANHIVIAEIYAGGGNSGATYTNDYISFYNPTSSSVDLSTWSLQYASATSTNWFKVDLTNSIDANSYYFIQLDGGSEGTALPFTPDLIWSKGISNTGGKLVLLNNQTSLDGTSDPSGNANLIDFVGYGDADAYEGSGAAPSISNTSCNRRKDNSGNQTYGSNGSGWESDDNSSDFYEETDMSNNPPLPVELSDFNGDYSNGKILLNWRTESEVNNFGFEVERIIEENGNANSQQWRKIGFVKGNGNSNAPNEYTFEEEISRSGIYKYRLKQLDFDGDYSYSKEIEINIPFPGEVILNQNFPNPFNPTTKISFALPRTEFVSLKVYDVLGREVETLLSDKITPGKYDIKFDGSGLNSGFYFYKIEGEDFAMVKKMVLVK